MAAAATELALLRTVEGRGSASVWRSLLLACGATLGLISLLSVLVWATDHDSTTWRPAGVLLIGGSVVVAVRIASGRLGWIELTGLLVVSAAAILYAPFSGLAQFVGPAVTSILLLAVVVSIRGRPALVAGVGLTLVSVVLRAQWGGLGWRVAATMGVLQLGMVTAAWVVVNALFRAVATSDALAEQLREAELRNLVLEAQHASQETVRRVLHDDVLTALRSLAEPATVPDATADAPSRKACREAVRAIRGLMAEQPVSSGKATPRRADAPPDGVTAGGLGALIVEGLLVGVSTRSLPGPSPSADVARALVLSAREALRNVGRHAGVNEANLTVDLSGRVAQVQVSDRGRGFSVRETQLGVGISSSIVSRMEEVGGSATLHSDDGLGSTWVLSGPAGRAVPEARMTNDASRRDFLAAETRRLALGLSVPMLAANLGVAILYVPSNRLSVAEVLVALAMTASTAAAAALVSRRPPGRAAIYGFSALQSLLLVVHMWAAGPGAAGDFRSWGAGFGALPLILLAFFVTPPAALAVLLLPYAAVLGVIVARDPVATLSASFGFLTATVAVVISWVLGIALRRSWRQVEQQRHQVHVTQVLDERRASVEEVKNQYLGRVVETVLPLLEAVSTGRGDLQSPGLRAEAAQLSLATRDDLYAPGFFAPDLRQQVTEFRRRGGVVDVRPGFPPGLGQGPAGTLLEGLVRDRTGVRRVILTYLPGRDGSVRVVVTPPLPAAELATLARIHQLGADAAGGDEFASWLLIADPHK
ncbi:MAG: hypothetical protein L0H96_13555 [Humibacillus sp.]|nr:hypothetical protein [Humibacillus sp.]MDN5777927.1 hypothetical protein [Humibacillus sp.]